MSEITGLSKSIVGVLLVGAEGCAETEGEPWLRDATEEERQAFIADCQGRCKAASKKFDYRNFTVDGIGRPYWLKTVLRRPDRPNTAAEKAAQYTRVVRLTL